MAIPESQLETWTHQGAIATAQATHLSIRAALDAFQGWPSGIDRKVYLQGSYRNSTNIRGDSDVDVVVHLTTTWNRDLTSLSEDQQQAYLATYPRATYLREHFRADVLRALKNYYGAGNITEGTKAIKVAPASGRLPAHVVPAILYRKYVYFYSDDNQHFIPGILFHTRTNARAVVNFPKPHYDNGVVKHTRTNQRYKATVRLFKNIRTHLVDNRRIGSDLAPSYFIECLLYNVPDNAFVSTNSETFANVVNYLYQNLRDDFLCQNGHVRLFGTSPEQWSQANSRTFLTKVIELWNGW